MTVAPELQPVATSAAVWHRYDPRAKADLWSSAIRTATGVYLVDPIAIDQESLAQYAKDLPIVAVIVTNENHVRDAVSFELPVFARFRVPGTSVLGTVPPADVEVVDVPGAPSGEIALVTSAGDLVIGDALINFEPYGFTFLPDKYCTDPRQMRRSLRELLAHDFERILFAHGTPITSNARARLESLLTSE